MAKKQYPPYPDSNWDYALKMSAATQLVPPNRCICIYCRKQAVKEEDIPHESDCPAKPTDEAE